MGAEVLIVEDNQALRASLADLLVLKGYEVMEAGNGSEALKKLRCGPPPGLILLDLMMPLMDGWTFLELKEKDPSQASIPVLVLSAVAKSHFPRPSKSLVAVLDKPVEIAELFSLIEQYCGTAPTLPTSRMPGETGSTLSR